MNLFIPKVIISMVQEKGREGTETSENLILEENLRILRFGA